MHFSPLNIGRDVHFHCKITVVASSVQCPEKCIIDQCNVEMYLMVLKIYVL
uniref:Uncharacterized protein n=1 Tax=Anguilla anguilla TaxID=7936 RepID=A0A0E9PKG4_ANGAN